MSSSYVRGPVCGVDNCPSRLWKRIDGRNVCQYGHVNEYDIEINDDDEMMENATMGGAGSQGPKRLTRVAGLTISQAKLDKITKLAMDKTIERQYGDKLFILIQRSFQIILAKQTKFLIEKFKLDEEIFISIIKRFWSIIIVAYYKGDIKKHRKTLESKNIEYNMLIIICYFSLIKIGFPIYYSDLISITFEKNFPLERGEYFLPKKIRLQIPITSIGLFHGSLVMDYFQFMNKAFKLKTIQDDFIDYNLNYFPLLVRTILTTKLPLEIIVLVKNCIDILKIKFPLDSKLHPELKLLSLVIVFGKLYFNLKPEKYSIWCSSYWKSYEDPVNYNSDIHTVRFRQELLLHSSFSDLLEWNNSKIEEFIKFYFENILPDINSLNIATGNNKTDRDRLHIAKSINEIFNFDPIVHDNVELINKYKEHLINIYTKFYADEDELLDNDYEEILPKDYTLVDRSKYTTNFVDILAERIIVGYNCPIQRLEDSLLWAKKTIISLKDVYSSK